MAEPVGTPVSVPSPFRLALTALAILFLADAVRMYFLLGGHRVAAALAAASLLVVLVAPFLWWCVVRPQRRATLAHQQAATVVAHAVDGIITLNERGLVESFNPAAERLFGFQAAEVLGGPMSRLMPERYREAHEAGLARLRSGGEPRLLGKTVELQGLRADGSEFPLELSLARWETGGGTFYTGVVRDISERKVVEERLRLQSTALESAVDAVLITDRDGRIAWVNPAFSRLTGYTAEEVLGQNPRLLKSGQHTQEFYRGLWETILAGQVWRGETINRRKDGSLFTEEQTITPVRDEGGEISHFICIKHDVTEGKRAQETLHALYRASLQIQERLDTTERLDRLIRVARELLQLDRVNILLADPSEEWLQAMASSETGELLETIRVPIRSGGGALAHAYLSQQTVVWDGTGSVPDAFRLAPPYDRIAALRSRVFAIVPLVVQGRAIGVLGVDRKSVRKPIEPATLELLQLFAAQAAIAIQNARLYAATQEKEREATKLSMALTLLNQASRALHRTLNVDTMLAAALDELARAFGAGAALVYVFSDRGIERSVGRWLSEAHGRDITHRPGGIADLVRQTRAPLVFRDIAEARDLVHPAHFAHGVRSLAAFPIVAQEQRVLGALFLYYTSPQEFPEADIHLLEAYAEHLGTALENAQVFSASEARASELNALREIGNAIGGRLELPVVLEAIVVGAMELLGGQHTQILLWDEGIGRLRYGAARGTEAERVRTQTFELGRGINGTVALSRQPMILDDYQASPYALPEFPDVVATITVPILFKDRLLGVLHTHTTQPERRFSPEAVRLFQMLAAQAAIAIENARLHEDALGQKTRLSQIFDSTSDGIVLVGPAGRIESANRRAGELLGFNPETIVGLGLADLVTDHFRSGGDYRRALIAFRSALLGDADGEKEGDLELASVRKVLHWVARPTKDALGAPVGLTLTFQDVTREREAEQMKSDFVSFATHQLRTPLAGIKWMLELAAQESGVPPDAGSFIQDARASAERLIRLVNDLLDASRLERGKITVVSESIHLGPLTQSILDEVALLIKEKGHSLSVSGADQVPPVLADPQLLRQVILNLVSNAIKYTLPGGRISVQMIQDGDMVRWAIQDSGIGIPREAQDRLFEKFYRAENVLAIETEGTGLGLYLVRLIVERLGGRVWCESEEGKGSTFLLTLRRGD